MLSDAVTTRFFLQSLLTLAGLLLLFVPPAWLASRALLLRGVSAGERLLWSVALSLPVGTMLCVLHIHPLPAAALAVVLWIALAKSARPRIRSLWTGSARMGVLSYLLIGGIVLVQLAPLHFGNKLEEPFSTFELGIRNVLVEAATRAAYPPQNPMYAIGGVSPNLHYYYYWYLPIAWIAGPLHLEARSAFAGSMLWALAGLLSLLWLCVRYLAQPTERRRLYGWAVLLMAASGLDVLPHLAQAFGRYHQALEPYPNVWIVQMLYNLDRGLVLLPHHYAGVVEALLGYLIVVLPVEPSADAQGRPASADWRLRAGRIAVAGICFAALAGTSTFIAVFVALSCVLWALWALWHRRFASVQVLVGATVVALVLTLPFFAIVRAGGLHTAEMTANAVAGAATAAAPVHYRFPFSLNLRGFNAGEVTGWNWLVAHGYRVPPAPWNHLLALALTPVLWFVSAGLLALVLVWRLVRDVPRLWRRTGGPHAFTDAEAALWCLGLVLLPMTVLVSSEHMMTSNDLPQHAGMVLRLLLVLWGVQAVAAWQAERHTRDLRWVTWLGGTLLVLGLATTLDEAVTGRFLVPLIESGYVLAPVPVVQDRQLSEHAWSLWQAYNSTRQSAADALVQAAPDSRYSYLDRMYTARRTAAGDLGCEADFGGSLLACRPWALATQTLFGGPERYRAPYRDAGPVMFGGRTEDEPQPPAPSPASVSPQAFATLCREQKLYALVAKSTDAAWDLRSSWVWNEPTLYADGFVRVVPCPTQ